MTTRYQLKELPIWSITSGPNKLHTNLTQSKPRTMAMLSKWDKASSPSKKYWVNQMLK